MKKLITGAGGFAAIVVAWAVLAASPATSVAGGDGKATFEKMCASCHGADGRGNAEKAATLKLDAALLNLGRPESAKIARDELKKILLEGKEKMPKYGKKLKADEQDPVLDYAMQLATEIRGKK